MSLKTRLGSLFAALFGRLSWEAPAWSQRLWALIRANRRALLGVFALSAAGAGVYAYVVTRPPPPNEVRLSAVIRGISSPGRRLKNEAVPTPQTLIIQFDGSAAPLADINKAITIGVSIRPAIDGEWKWLNERTLGFTPKTPWPVGEKYKVSMAQQLVNRPNTVLATKELELTVEPFAVSVASFEFYQDPVDPSVKQVVGTFRFNYPVDPESFEKRLKLDSVPSSNKTQHEAHKYTVSYDDLRFEAYVRSENLPMPIEDHIATLLLTKGAKAAGSSSGDEVDHPSTVIIPGKGSKFHVNGVQATIARSAEGDPDQVLIFTCASTVNENVFAPAVKVWVLPKDKPATSDQSVIKDYGWSATEVGPEILKKSPRLKLTAIPGEHEVGEVQSYKIDLKPGRIPDLP